MKSIFFTGIKSFAACAVMSAAVLIIGQALHGMGTSASKAGYVLTLVIQVGLGAVVYGICLMVLRVKEVSEIVHNVVKLRK
jgi:peptidoglycan biosynthesis protein MviN/MurJ (putative lipid II flippase)